MEEGMLDLLKEEACASHWSCCVKSLLMVSSGCPYMPAFYLPDAHFWSLFFGCFQGLLGMWSKSFGFSVMSCLVHEVGVTVQD